MRAGTMAPIEEWRRVLGSNGSSYPDSALGDRGLLAGWVLRQREAVQIMELDALWRPPAKGVDAGQK